jgi:hypothetical protein
MLASRSLVSVLVRALGDFSLHPQDRPAGGLRPPSAGKTTLVGDEAVCLERHRGAGPAARARSPSKSYDSVSPGSSPSWGEAF